MKVFTFTKWDRQHLKKIALFFLLWINAGICTAQDDPYRSLDSLQKILAKSTSSKEQAQLMGRIGMIITNIAPATAIQTSLKGASVAMTIHDTSEHAFCLTGAGWGYFRLGKDDSAKFYLLDAVNEFKQVHLRDDEAKAMLKLANVYQHEYNDQVALNYVMKAIPLFDSILDPTSKAYAQKLIGVNYRKQNQYQQALIYTDNSISGFKQLNNYPYLADALLSKGNIFLKMKKWDSAFAYYDQSLLFYRMSHQLISSGYVYEDKANIFILINKQQPSKKLLDSAFYYYQKAYNIFEAGGNEADEAYEQLKIGNTLSAEGKYAQAENYLSKAISVFVNNKIYSYAYDAATELSDVYKQQKDYKNSLTYLSLSIDYRDSVEANNQDKPMDEMLVKYETDKKDKAIQLLNTQKELAAKELSRNRLILIFSISIIVLLIIIGVILRAQNRIRQRLKEVQMRNQIASDLHDDVGSSLSSILLLSNIAAEFKSNPNEKSILDKIGNNTKEVIEKMSDIVWTMKPGNDEGSSMKEKLQKLSLWIKDISGIEMIAVISDKLEEVKLDMATRKNIFLICKEAMNNVLKHADATTIYFSVDIAHQNIVITINDNGKGFVKATTKTNNGTETMLQRAIDCNGTCVIDSIPGRGTNITVTIPIPNNRYTFS
jgi:two-component system sensor histidine kinase UhpB